MLPELIEKGIEKNRPDRTVLCQCREDRSHMCPPVLELLVTGSVVTLHHHAGITTARQVDAQVSE